MANRWTVVVVDPSAARSRGAVPASEEGSDLWSQGERPRAGLRGAGDSEWGAAPSADRAVEVHAWSWVEAAVAPEQVPSTSLELAEQSGRAGVIRSWGQGAPEACASRPLPRQCNQQGAQAEGPQVRRRALTAGCPPRTFPRRPLTRWFRGSDDDNLAAKWHKKASMSALPSDASALAADHPSSALRDSSAALLAQAADDLHQGQQHLRDSSAALLAKATAWKDGLTRGEPTGRLANLDAGRVIATYGVMWTHVAEMQGHSPAWAALGRFGTSFYVAAAVFFAARTATKKDPPPFRRALEVRLKRLLLPFLLWSLIYAVFYYIVTRPTGMSLMELTKWWGPFAGTARHLWFLPFAAFAGTFAFWLTPRLLRFTPVQLAWGGAALALGTYWLFYRVVFFAMDRLWAIDWHLHRLDRWIEEIPLMVASIFASALYIRATTIRALPAGGHRLAPERAEVSASRDAPPAWTGSPRIAVALAVGFLALEIFYLQGFAFIDLVTHSEGRFIANLAGLFLLGIFLTVGTQKWVTAIAPLGRLTYFAFLSHVLLLDMVNSSLALLPGHGRLGFAVLSTLLLLAVCVLIGAFVRRSAALRWLIP
jgi:hypothetical protein